MVSAVISRELVMRTYPGSTNPLTKKEVAIAILPAVRSFIETPEGSDVTLLEVSGAYNRFMMDQGLQAGNADMHLRTLNSHHVAEGNEGFSEEDLLALADIGVQWSPIGLIRSLPGVERNQLPVELYDLVRFDRYEHCGSI